MTTQITHVTFTFKRVHMTVLCNLWNLKRNDSENHDGVRIFLLFGHFP